MSGLAAAVPAFAESLGLDKSVHLVKKKRDLILKSAELVMPDIRCVKSRDIIGHEVLLQADFLLELIEMAADSKEESLKMIDGNGTAAFLLKTVGANGCSTDPNDCRCTLAYAREVASGLIIV